MKLKIMIMALLLLAGIGSAVNKLPATTFTGDVDFLAGYYPRNATQGEIFVTDYGAVGDGETDDTAAFQAVQAECLTTHKTMRIPDGDFLITSPLDMPHYYDIVGEGYGSNLVLNLSEGEFCFSNETSAKLFWRIENLRFSVDSGAETTVGGIRCNVTYRQGMIRDIYSQHVENVIDLGPCVWGDTLVENVMLMNTDGAVRNDNSVAIKINGSSTYPANAMRLRNIEIIGAFGTGLKLDQAVNAEVDGFNIAGSTAYYMGRAININNSRKVSVGHGYIEGIDGLYSIAVRNLSKEVQLNNIHISAKPVLISEESVVTSSGVQWNTHNNDFCVVKNSELYMISPEFVDQYSYTASGTIHLLDLPATKAGGLLLSPIIKSGSTVPWIATSGSASIADSSDFVTGDRSYKVSVTVANSGISITRSGLVPGNTYTVVALVKLVGGATRLRLTAGAAATTFDASHPGKFEVWSDPDEGEWRYVYVPFNTSDGTITAKIVLYSLTAGTGYFLVDSVDIFPGYNPYTIETYTLDDMISGERYKMAAAPAGGTWRLGDKVYHTTPAAGGTIGWVCTSAGAPGTWKAFGAIAA